MKSIRFLLLAPIAILASCASDDSSGSSSAAASAPQGARIRSLAEWENDISKDNGFTTDANGNYVPKSNKRSSFDRNRNSAYFKGEQSKKEFAGTKQFAKKSWWGDTSYEKKSYTGNTDGSRFQTASRLQGQGAREGGTAANLPGRYETGSYKTGSAREAGNRSIARTSDAETDVRRRVFDQPEVMNYRQQRATSMQETKSFLGR